MKRHLLEAADVARAAALGGVTAAHAMANTDPVADTAGVVEQVGRLGREAGLVDVVPVGVESWPVTVSYDLDSALPKADVVMMLRVQAERMNASFFPSAREYSRRYGLDARRMAALPDDAIVMHPGPMNRGMEIAAEVADSVRSTIVEQVGNGVSVRMAVLYLLLGGKS